MQHPVEIMSPIPEMTQLTQANSLAVLKNWSVTEKKKQKNTECFFNPTKNILCYRINFIFFNLISRNACITLLCWFKKKKSTLSSFQMPTYATLNRLICSSPSRSNNKVASVPSLHCSKLCIKKQGLQSKLNNYPFVCLCLCSATKSFINELNHLKTKQ